MEEAGARRRPFKVPYLLSVYCMPHFSSLLYCVGKVCDAQRMNRKGVVVKDLEELRRVADQKFGVGASCRVFLDVDGTEIEDDEYLSFVKADSRLMVTASEDKWTPEESQPDATSMHPRHRNPDSCESNESLVIDLTDAGEGIRPNLIRKIKVDPAFFVSLSEEDLQDIVELDVNNFAEVLGQGELEAKHYQEVCQREIDKRTEYKEATALLRLYHKTQENSDEARASGVLKRNRKS